MKAWEVTSFREAEDYINHINRFTNKNTLADSASFFEYLGCPGEECELIHVAGTNGKGSVCCYLSEILRVDGCSVALFTSPHLITIRERFRINGRMISEEEFLEEFLYCMNQAVQWREDYHPTFFELLFFMGMHWFSKNHTDVIVLETGLGGRLDTTNVIKHPKMCVITSIGMDHTEYLGDTIEKIAFEKAGIIKKQVPVVYLADNPKVSRIIEKKAAESGAETIPVSVSCITNLNFKENLIDFSVHTSYYGDSDLTVRTLACYQTKNAALVVHACGRLGIAEADVHSGLLQAHWAGRMEEVLPGVFVDGAHNEDGINALMRTIKQVGVRSNTLLFGVVKDKDYRGMLRLLTEGDFFERIIPVTVTSAGNRALLAGDIEALLESMTGKQERAFSDAAEALEYVLSFRQTNTIYIAGSLYLVGQVEELLKGGTWK